MLSFKSPNIDDMLLYYEWASDPEVRERSFNSNSLDIETHKKWFESAIENKLIAMYLFQDSEGNNVGQIRIQIQEEKKALIGISVDIKYRGKGYASEMLLLASEDFLKMNQGFTINAYIKDNNLYSKFAFEKAGFTDKGIIRYENHNCFFYIKKCYNEN